MVLYSIFRLVFGTLYPAYASYKAVKSKNVKEYVKWMMYWIVFALFTCVETITDVFLSWFPFYYEIKIIMVIWLLSPATKGSSFLYRKFVHPMLSSREQEIDEYISKAREQSYKQVLDLGSKGVNVLMQTALKNLPKVAITPSEPTPEPSFAQKMTSSISDSLLSRARSTVDGLVRSHTTETNAPYYSDDEMEVTETRSRRVKKDTKEPKRSKSKTRVTKKRTQKTED